MNPIRKNVNVPTSSASSFFVSMPTLQRIPLRRSAPLPGCSLADGFDAGPVHGPAGFAGRRDRSTNSPRHRYASGASAAGAARESPMPIAQNLIGNETIEFSSKKHWIAPVRDSAIPVLLLVGAYLLNWISPDAESGLFSTIGNLLDLVRAGLVVVAIGWIVYNVIVWRTAEFAVTNLRVVREEGFISRRSSATLLSSVSDVQSKVGLLGKSVGYGDLEIFTQSGSAGADRFKTITQPEAFRNAILTHKMGETGAATGAAAAPVSAPGPAATPRRPPLGIRPRRWRAWPTCAIEARSRPTSTRRRRPRSSPGCRTRSGLRAEPPAVRLGAGCPAADLAADRAASIRRCDALRCPRSSRRCSTIPSRGAGCSSEPWRSSAAALDPKVWGPSLPSVQAAVRDHPQIEVVVLLERSGRLGAPAPRWCDRRFRAGEADHPGWARGRAPRQLLPGSSSRQGRYSSRRASQATPPPRS